MSLKKFEKNIQSQYGEDGVIEEIFNRLPKGKKICVEFGAWDGVKYSNTWNLWHNKGWQAVLIEGITERFKDLLKYENKYHVKAINKFVSISGENSIDNILSDLNFGINDIDLMSIDVDGNDYYIFESLKKFSPKCVVIEYNPTIPVLLDVIQKEDQYFGASSLALFKLAQKKNYKLVHATITNLFFVHNNFFPELNVKEPLLSDIVPQDALTYAINAYNGDIFFTRVPTYTNINKLKNIQNYETSNELIAKNFNPIKINLTPKITEKIILKLSNLIKKVLKKFMKRFLSPKRKIEKKEIIYQFGSPVPMPTVLKQNLIINYAKKLNYNIFIETGTYMGDMLLATKDHFNMLFSVELDKKLFEDASEKFKNIKNIELFRGDSTNILPEILKEINEKAIFWLDGHYSGGITAKGNSNTPILQELDAILRHPVKDHLILIDDARCFIGEYDYPTLFELKDFIHKYDNSLKINVKDDIIRIGKMII